jgi:uncharacterized protein
MSKTNQKLKECIYSVNGMHCSSCEILIEKKLSGEKNIEFVDASISKKQVAISYIGSKPSLTDLNKLFKSDGYTFNKHKEEDKLFSFKEGSLVVNKEKLSSLIFIILGVLLVFLLYSLVERSGIATQVSIDAVSTLPAFFIFGVIAGLSTCAALVGGLVLSMSRQWYDLHSSSNSFTDKIQPHLLFNIGRLISFVILGGVLGFIGSFFTLSPIFTAVIGLFVAIMMVLIGMQLLGFQAFQKLQLSAPKFVTRYIADEKNFKGRYMPSILGALTFFLPCGFTITAQGLAIASGDPIRGALIMMSFALGTAPILLLIGISSTKIYEKAKFATYFVKFVGIVVIFFGLATMNMQLGILGLPNINDIKVNSGSVSNQDGLALIEDGVQVIRMEAYPFEYSPNYFKVKAGVPVRWEIDAVNVSGCTNAIISNSLFDGQIPLINGEISYKEFTPLNAGKYRFSCWMGMVTGVIEVVN